MILKKCVKCAPIIFTLLLCSCANENGNISVPEYSESVTVFEGYRKITAEEAYRMMNELTDYILLDVRTEEEFREIRIENAVLIPDYEISERAGGELSDKDALILVYCRRGRRSENVSRELVEMGYTNIYDFGGIEDWLYETVSG